MIEWLVNLLGLVTKKEFLMLKDDLNDKLAALNVAVDALKVRVDDAVAEANANSVTQAEVDAVAAAIAKVDAVLAPVAEPGPEPVPAEDVVE